MVESLSGTVRGEGADIASRLDVEDRRGGGSMNVEEPCVIASGNNGISSLAEDVSMVMWLVGLDEERRV